MMMIRPGFSYGFKMSLVYDVTHVAENWELIVLIELLNMYGNTLWVFYWYMFENMPSLR